MIIDAWAQHPTLRHLRDPIFDSLRRWTKVESPAAEARKWIALHGGRHPAPGVALRLDADFVGSSAFDLAV